MALIMHGIGVNEPPPDGGKPPLAAAIEGTCTPDVLRVLVESREQVNITTNLWDTLLSKLPSTSFQRPLIQVIVSRAVVAESKHVILLRLGARENARDRVGNTPFLLACRGIDDSPV